MRLPHFGPQPIPKHEQLPASEVLSEWRETKNTFIGVLRSIFGSFRAAPRLTPPAGPENEEMGKGDAPRPMSVPLSQAP